MPHLSSVIFLSFTLLFAQSFSLESTAGSIRKSFNSSVQSDPASHSSTSPTWLSIPSGCMAPYPLLFASAGLNWTFSNYQALNDTFAVYQPLFGCPSRYLAASSSCDDLYVRTIPESHCEELSHVWIVKAVTNRTGYFTMTNYARKGKECLRSLLSTSNDGTLSLTDVDDGSGKQHWKLQGAPDDEGLSLLNDIVSGGKTGSARPAGKKSSKK